MNKLLKEGEEWIQGARRRDRKKADFNNMKYKNKIRNIFAREYRYRYQYFN
jgi:hypothetical protein